MWRIRWTDERGRRRSECFANKKDAQFKLDQHLLEKREVQRGLRGLAIPDKTFSQLCDHWLIARAKRKRSGDDDKSIIRAHLRPFFGHALVRNISQEEARQFVDARDHLSLKTLNNHLTLLIAMLNEARECGWLRETPRIKKFKVSLCDADYSWLRTTDEVARFLQAAKADKNPAAFTLFASAIYTGMREGELAGLEWASVDFERRLITVKGSFDGPTKSGRIRHVPLLEPLVPVLRDWRLRTPGPWVFPNAAGNMRQESDRIFQEVLHRVLDRAEFPTIQRNNRTRRYVVFHDLRHTFASHWVLNGGDIFVLQKILGHHSIQMTQRYAHLAPEVFTKDLCRMGTAIPTTGTVVPLSIGQTAP